LVANSPFDCRTYAKIEITEKINKEVPCDETTSHMCLFYFPIKNYCYSRYFLIVEGPNAL